MRFYVQPGHCLHYKAEQRPALRAACMSPGRSCFPLPLFPSVFLLFSSFFPFLFPSFLPLFFLLIFHFLPFLVLINHLAINNASILAVLVPTTTGARRPGRPTWEVHGRPLQLLEPLLALVQVQVLLPIRRNLERWENICFHIRVLRCWKSNRVDDERIVCMNIAIFSPP